MNKTTIKNFAVWARSKLIADITYKASLLGVTEAGINAALPQSTRDVEFYDIGTKEPYAITGEALRQRKQLAELISQKAKESDYKTAYRSVLEEVAYTWFNRLIAIRFMEVNDYLPSRIRVLSAESGTKLEPDLVTTPFEAELALSDYDKAEIVRLKTENQVDELFRLLFIRQCNALNAILPKLFEKTADYTELLLNVSVTDQDGVVYHLVHDIAESDFDVVHPDEDGKPTGQVEIIGWLYQYYNDERRNEVINIYKGIVNKEDIPAATQLFTTDWVVQYVVDNSLGRYWIERHPESNLKDQLSFFVTPKDGHIEHLKDSITPEDLQVLDPCMGSGHFLVYAFDVLMKIYAECGYSERDAAKSILEHNLYGLDIDDRAFQLAYFAVMMKARQYNRRILDGETDCHVYAIQESNGITSAPMHDMGLSLTEEEYGIAVKQAMRLVEEFHDAKEYGSILNITPCDWNLLRRFAVARTEEEGGQLVFGVHGEQIAAPRLQELINIGEVMAQKYDAVVTNPPYLNKMDAKLKSFVTEKYKEYSADMFSVFMFRNFGFCKKDGYVGFMTPFVWMFIKTYEPLRKYILNSKAITTLVQMEYSAFEEATVPICSFALKNGKSENKSLCFRLSDFKGGMEVQKQKVLEAQANKECGYFYEAAQDNFEKIPGAPVAYWVSFKLLKAFEDGRLLGTIADSKQGLATGCNDIFIRQWFELQFSNIEFNAHSINDAKKSEKKWFPYNKGGEFRKWYGNNDFVVNWENNGFLIRNFKNDQGKIRSRPQNTDYYFRECFSWSLVSSGVAAFRYKPFGHIFDIAGMSCFTNNSLEYLLGLCNSKIVLKILEIIAPTINYQCGDIASIPVLDGGTNKSIVERLTKSNIVTSKADWDFFETSWDFSVHPLVRGETTVKDAFARWQSECNDRFNTLKSNEDELNRIFIGIYGLQDELTPDVEDKDVTVRKADLGRDVRSLLSYAVGCMFGRYSLDVPGLAYAGGAWDDSKYTTFIPDKDNILPITDEEYFEDDIVGLLIAWLKKVYGEKMLEENLDFIAGALGYKGSTSREVIRNYFVNDFFADHCKVYQKRPIYWLFDSGKQNGFKALIYLHRYDENTIGNLRIDYLHRMERVYESEIARMQDVIDNSSAAREVTAAAKRKEKLLKQLKECKDYDEKIAHLALARISLDLDDGVKANYRKLQTGTDGKFYEVLADSSTIMEKKQ